MQYTNIYEDEAHLRHEIEDGRHRDVIGGLWDEMGPLQLRVLQEHGLRPEHRFLDIGCGCFRGGVHLISYLDAFNYYGIDASEALIQTGFEREIAPTPLQAKTRRENMLADSTFAFERFESTFDRALAFSVFTHISLNSIRMCLEKLAPVMAPNGMFYATFFRRPEAAPSYQAITHSPGDITTFGDKDPFHYSVSDFETLCRQLPWRIKDIGKFGHPRAQELLCFEKV